MVKIVIILVAIRVIKSGNKRDNNSGNDSDNQIGNNREWQR